ncbi:MAG TPA: transcriptional regulator [Arsenophonus nasoniae]|uniref:transcriptional regulator n=1 Tax=Arsenophonus nasoniae TaxID=638 RepID=UPI00387A098F
MDLKTYTTQKRGRTIYLGRELGVAQALVSQWSNKVRPVPVKRCLEIEKATFGEVLCEDLRPDIDWSYLRGTDPLKLKLGS